MMKIPSGKYAGYILPFLFLTAILLQGCSEKKQNCFDAEPKIKNDSIAIKLADERYMDNLQKEINALELKWTAEYADSLSKVKNTGAQVTKVAMGYKANIEEINKVKDNMIFAANRELTYLKCNKPKPDILLLIGIVLLAGIIGGIAGPKFDLLSDNAKAAVNNVVEATRQLLSQQNFRNTLTEAQQSATENDLAVISKELDKKAGPGINIVFGIIASAMTFLGLSFFDSKVLDFSSVMHYFIFTGYCLVASVFAKNWIRRIYDRIGK